MLVWDQCDAMPNIFAVSVCAKRADVGRLRTAKVKPSTVTTVRAARRAKAFFVAQKVNGRNAP